MFGINLFGKTEPKALRVLYSENKLFEALFDYVEMVDGQNVEALLDINQMSGFVGFDRFNRYLASKSSCILTVYSMKGQQRRTVEVFGKLNASVQLTPLKTADYVWHILNVVSQSPASQAGIISNEYIVQMEGGLLATGGEELIGRVVHSHYLKNNNQPTEIVLYVYNHDANCIRPVRVTVREGWGGNGLLGCDIGYGLLHRIPPQSQFQNYPSSETKKEVINEKSVYYDPPKVETFSPPSAVANSEDLDGSKSTTAGKKRRNLRPVVDMTTFKS
ncbi:Grh1 protein [Martiniozyma asiatica (nom. inval.)]|nr:Grh1 protein [Martiniozyma asiatica]